MKGKLYTYVVKVDAGFAPNPFWDVCTLAACTPNHQGSRIKLGDWVAGFLNKKRGNRFLYAMHVDEVIGLDDYYRDPRYQNKKPNLRGTWKQRCGDNIYSLDDDGRWIQHKNCFHLNERLKEQDTRYARVFIGRRFWYFGKSAVILPIKFKSLAGGRGTRVNHNPIFVDKFCLWVEENFDPGIHGEPNDNPDI